MKRKTAVPWLSLVSRVAAVAAGRGRPSWKAVLLRLCAVLAFTVLATEAFAQAEPCTAVPVTVGDEIVSVTVTCEPGEESSGFATSIGSTETYDGNGNDVVRILGGVIVATGSPPPQTVAFGPLDGPCCQIDMLDGDNRFEITSGQVGTPTDPVPIFMGNGDDLFIASGGEIYGEIVTDEFDFDSGTFGAGSDEFRISGTAFIRDKIFAGEGDNIFRMTGGFVGEVQFESGNDTVDISGGQVGELVFLSGINRVTLSGNGQIGPTGGPQPALDFLGGTNTFIMTGGLVSGSIAGGTGMDRFEISGGTVSATISGDAGNDTISIQGGSVGGSIFGGDDDDTIDVSGGTVGGAITGDAGNDTVTLSGGSIGTFIDGGAGGDTISVQGGTLGTDIFGSEGDDTVNVSGGTVGGSILGDGGSDTVTVSGGTVAGGIDAETVRLFGGTIGGDITGLSATTLVINDGLGAAPLNLSNGVLFSGTNAVGTISNTDLAQFGGGAFQSQNFSGFSSVSANGSTLGFIGSTQIIDQLNLLGGAILYGSGNIQLQSQAGGLGNLLVNNSTLNLINGNPTDVLSVGNLTLNNATLAIDVNQSTRQADQLLAGGAFVATGTNIVRVNLAGVPVFLGFSEIPIVTAGNAVTGSFTVQGIPGTAAALFNYQILPGADGGLILLATPADLTVLSGAQMPLNSQTVATALDAIDGITDYAAEFGLGLAGGGTRVAISPTFGVFASGQFARVQHDGFTVTSNGASGPGPSFDANDFSAAISLDFNAAKHFEFDDRYGLNLGLFAGYTSSDVTLDSFQGFPNVGDGTNEGGMFGAYGLFRQGLNYALVSATTFIGKTDITYPVLNSTGSYDTIGYAVTASAGHIFPLSDVLRFDLRGGILGVSFEGDGFTDSQGNVFGESEISFGAVKFDPGIYGDYALENGMVLSPYARAELQQRFSVENSASVAGVDFFFDDSDFSASLSTGFNLKVSQSTTLSAEVRGKASSDSTTLAGKIGLKVGF